MSRLSQRFAHAPWPVKTGAALLITALIFYLTVVREVIADGLQLTTLVFVLCLSFMTVFMLLLMTATLTKGGWGMIAAASRSPVEGLINLWIMTGLLFICTLLMYALAYREIGILDMTASGKVVHEGGECLYFAVVTWTTLGYGDLVPRNGFGRLVAGLEAFTGYLVMAAFVATLVAQFNLVTKPVKEDIPS